MSDAEIRFSDLIDLVPCPFCKAPVRESCRTSTGDLAIQYHSARVGAASQAVSQLCADRRNPHERQS
jgi:hypothetical protein